MDKIRLSLANPKFLAAFRRFGSGTQHTLLGKQKLIVLPDEICCQISWHLECSVKADI